MTAREYLRDVLDMAMIDGTPYTVVEESMQRANGVSQPPTTPNTGDIWIRNDETGETYVWDGKNWVQVSA